MVAKRKKKYSSGEGSQFISRKGALKKLQLNLRDFRKICILKGIYPREPRNRKRAQKGDTSIKTLYHVKDIQFLLHEPLIWKMRDHHVFTHRVKRAKALQDFELMNRLLKNHPTLQLDHIVKERYPTFIDAIRDLDDCLTLCFLFSTFPSLKHVPRDHSLMCRRLTVEFLHYVIEARALRKVFVSIKGYYYQAEIKGQTVTWIVPHHFSFKPHEKNDVDFTVMAHFVEFYITMLGFVNFRLYHSLNLIYPPKFSDLTVDEVEKTLADEDAFVSERVAALNTNLIKTKTFTEEEEVTVDQFTLSEDPSKLDLARKEMQEINNLKKLFEGLKFFINREVPREPLTFIIRSFGGQVSWDKLLFVGATYPESDETITHQIVDRPSVDKQFLSRYYIQPQWVFDSVNARKLLPVENYLFGCVLPPHLSPFTETQQSEGYVPPEQMALEGEGDANEAEEESESESEEEEEAVETKEDESEDEKIEEDVKEKEESEEEEEEKDLGVIDKEKANERKEKKKKMAIKVGEVAKESPFAKKREERQQYRLREKMVIRKHRGLYRSMKAGQAERRKEAWLLAKKRKRIDAEKKAEKKALKKASKSEVDA